MISYISWMHDRFFFFCCCFTDYRSDTDNAVIAVVSTIQASSSFLPFSLPVTSLPVFFQKLSLGRCGAFNALRSPTFYDRSLRVISILILLTRLGKESRPTCYFIEFRHERNYTREKFFSLSFLFFFFLKT